MSGSGISFSLHEDFVFPTTEDSGEVHALALGDFDDDGDPALLLVGEALPRTSLNSTYLRLFDWLR